MKLSAHYIALFATALAADTALVAWCVENLGRPPLIRKQENPDRPLSSKDAPWICLLTWTGAEFGELSEADTCAVNLTVGIAAPDADDVEQMGSAARVEQERTETAAGIEEVGDAGMAETFLARAVNSLMKANVGALIQTVGADSDGWSQYPLQVASAVLSITNPPKTFS